MPQRSFRFNHQKHKLRESRDSPPARGRLNEVALRKELSCGAVIFRVDHFWHTFIIARPGAGQNLVCVPFCERAQSVTGLLCCWGSAFFFGNWIYTTTKKIVCLCVLAPTFECHFAKRAVKFTVIVMVNGVAKGAHHLMAIKGANRRTMLCRVEVTNKYTQ